MPRKAKAVPFDKPKLGLPSPLEAAQETARNAQAGAFKLQHAVDALRTGLETIVSAEFDHTLGTPVGARELREMAAATLDAYSQLVGQSWRRNPLIGSRAGDRSDASGYGS